MPEKKKKSKKHLADRRNSTMGVAFIGASMRATGLIPYLKDVPNAKWIGIYDLLPTKSNLLAKTFKSPDVTIYDSLQAAVTDPRANAVIITTPDHAHVAPVQAALQAGKHVYCEKPMATTLADCDAIIQATGRSDKVAYMGMNLRHAPVYQKIHELTSGGKLGQMLTIEANEYYFEGRSYFRRWNRLSDQGGGLWITKACHDFDLLNWISGGRPVRVFATSSLSYYRHKPAGGTHCRTCPIRKKCPDFYNIAKPPNKLWDNLGRLTEEATGQPRDVCLYNSRKDTFDNGIAVVEFDNGVKATYTLSVVTARSTRQMRIQGTAGTMDADLDEGQVTFWERYTGKKQTFDLRKDSKAVHCGADSRILQDFFHCCATGRSPLTNWRDGRRSVQVGLAARESSRTGKPVIVWN